MSMDTMQTSGQYREHVPTSAAYSPSGNIHYEEEAVDPERYYANQPYYPSRHTEDDLRYTPQQEQNPVPTSYHPQTTNLPYHVRNQSAAPDQYDGPPIPPPRTSSQQQSSGSQSVHVRHARNNIPDSHSGRVQNRVGDYNEEALDRPRDDTATAAASAARNRRKGPTSPEGPQRATSTRERSHHTAPPPTRSEATMQSSNPQAPLVREYSEVIHRVVVSDPQEDEERAQERVAEAHPAPIGADNASTAADSEDLLPAPGPARRQDYSKSRRKEIQFGDYVLGQTLGEGEFGKVKLGWKKDGSSQVAIKLIRRESVASNPSRLPKIYREITILRDLAHPNIVRLHEMVETERHIGIILEYASGGELFDYILNHRYLKDPAARRLFAQLVSGVGYLHKKGIVHRDLKLENLLLDQNRNIIITDFGFANTFDPTDELSDEIVYNLSNKDFVRKFKLDRLDQRGMRRGDLMQTSCGSPCYAAPELVVSDSLYTGKKVDVWSCGVILYAMLAGYLPFDDDPSNPEGDNINLLYKYITTTPLTFPEYVTPHARDLLRRILVPDPRKRADLFEVARHSWLSEYHHVVSHITSSTTNVADIAHTTVPSEEEPPPMHRSASVREAPSKASGTSPGAIARTPEGLLPEVEEGSTGSRRDRSTRHTLQPEYVPPQTHTARHQPSESTSAAAGRGGADDSQHTPNATLSQSLSKPLPQEPAMDHRHRKPQSAEKMPPPVRPGRDIPRSVSDSTTAFGQSAPTSGHQYVTRPSTQGSMTSAGVPRSDVRLPSRGSYGQPVAPTVAATNVQGRVTQPTKPSRGYNISGPIPQSTTHPSIGQPTTTPMPPQSVQQVQKSHHRRSSTLSGLGERLFGRSNSVIKKDAERQKNGRKYPPTSMKEYPAEVQPRMSTDSKRSFSFGLGKKRSTDLENQGQTEKAVRRFSLLSTMSFKGLMGGSKDETSSKPGTPQADRFASSTSSRPATGQQYASGAVGTTDGQYDSSRGAQYNNYSRPPQQPQQRGASGHASTDVYGGTGVYSPYDQGRVAHQRQQSEPMAHMMTQQAEAVESRPSMQQGRQRGVLVKNNRKFTDAYAHDHGPNHHGGRSGAVKKVQDFFRRRRGTEEYR